MLKILKTTVHWIFGIALVAVIGLFLVSLLRPGAAFQIKIVKSGSMEPALKTGSIVFIMPRNSYSVGDVVTFGEDSKNAIPTTHRLVATRTEGNTSYFNTKGDANATQDPEEITQANIIGKVVFTIPFAGYILDFARQPWGFALLIGIPATLVVLYELIGIIEEVRAMMRRKKQSMNDSTQTS